MEYFPFGERRSPREHIKNKQLCEQTFIEERNGTDYTNYLYNGKEFDEEIGLYYYGARYYDPRISIWQSTDRFAEKYPNISPYSYCANSPIINIDPNGDTLSVTTNSGKFLFMLDDGKDEMNTITAWDLYNQGTQWFEPEADNYMALIGKAEGLGSFSELKHFSWKQIEDFSEEDRWMMSYRQGGSGDWKASSEGADEFYLVTVDESPYWVDAIGQIPFAVDKYTDELFNNNGNTDISIRNTILAGREYGEGKLIGGTPDNSNTYDNYFILRGALWAKQRYMILYSKNNNKPYLYNTGNSNNYLKGSITPNLRNKYLR